jgi:hypothetical protein
VAGAFPAPFMGGYSPAKAAPDAAR